MSLLSRRRARRALSLLRHRWAAAPLDTIVFDSGIEPDTRDPVAVLAFCLTPARVFAPGDREQEQAVALLLADAKRAVLLRWYEARRAERQN